MKTTYTCEKCHAQYEDSSDAWDCENSHQRPTIYHIEYVKSFPTQYAQKAKYPTEILMRGDEQYNDDAKRYEAREYVVYKLHHVVSSSVTAKYNAEIETVLEAERAEWQERMRAIEAAEEAAKAEKAAEESALTEA